MRTLTRYAKSWQTNGASEAKPDRSEAFRTTRAIAGGFYARGGGSIWQSRSQPFVNSLSSGLVIWFFFLLFPYLAQAGTNDGSVLLMNDSPYILTATIQASDGTFLGQFSIQPGQQKNFTTNLNPTNYLHPGTPQTSLTPYTVIWQCPSEAHYSMCTVVSPGSLCKANDCPGPRFCSPKQEIKTPASTLKKTQ